MANAKLPRDAYDKFPADLFLNPRSTPKSVQRKKQRNRRQQKALNHLLAVNVNGRDPKWWDRYKRHINSDLWRTTKDRLLLRRGNMCERCGQSGSIKRLDLHHLTYARLGHEDDDDLKLYCRDCHGLMHPNKSIRGRA